MNREQKNRIFITIAIIGGLLMIYALLQMFVHQRFVSYQSDDGYSIDYPAQWYINPEKIDGVSVIFHSPPVGEADDFSENVTIVVQDLKGNPMGLKKYSDLAILQLRAVFKSGITILEDESFRLGGRLGHKLVVISRSEDMDIQMMIVWALKDGKAYQINYTATGETFNEYLDSATKMIESFEIK